MLERNCARCGTLNYIPPEREQLSNRCQECGEVLEQGGVVKSVSPAPRTAAVEPPPPASPPASVPPPPPEPASAPSAVGRFSSNVIRDYLSCEISAVVHTLLILILAVITETAKEDTQLSLLASTTVQEVFSEELEQPIDAINIAATEEAIAPEAIQVQFDPGESARELQLEAGPEAIETAGGIDLVQEFGLPTSPATLLLGGGRLGSGSTLHGRSDLAAFATRLTKARAKTGDIQISLIWNNFNDLDLHVQAPSGEVLFYAHRRSRCRGELDIDMNASGRQTRKPVENIYWPTGRAPFGEYIVTVDHFANHDDPDPTYFEVLVQVDGVPRKFSDSIIYGDSPRVIHRFERKARPKGDSPNDDFPL